MKIKAVREYDHHSVHVWKDEIYNTSMWQGSRYFIESEVMGLRTCPMDVFEIIDKPKTMTDEKYRESLVRKQKLKELKELKLSVKRLKSELKV